MAFNQKEMIEAYKSIIPVHERLTQIVKQSLSGIVEKEAIQLAMPIQARPKDLLSFLEKVERKAYTDPSTQMTDLSGARIVVFSEDDVRFVADVIDDNFKIDRNRSIDKKKSLGRDKFGYSGTNYVVSFLDEDPILVDHGEFKGKFFEVQILSMCQLVWEEMQRKIEYKAEDFVSPLLSRRLLMLCALFELADLEFQYLLEKGITELLTKTITIRSLRIYINKSKNVQKTLSNGLKKGVVSRASPEEDLTRFNDLYEASSIAKLELLSELDDIVAKETLISHLLNSIEKHVRSIRAGPITTTLLLLYHHERTVTRELLLGKGWNENTVNFLVDRD